MCADTPIDFPRVRASLLPWPPSNDCGHSSYRKFTGVRGWRANTIEAFRPSGSNAAFDLQGWPAGEERPDRSAADRLQGVASLLALHQRLGSGTPPAHLQADIDRLLAELMPTRLYFFPPPVNLFTPRVTHWVKTSASAGRLFPPGPSRARKYT